MLERQVQTGIAYSEDTEAEHHDTSLVVNMPSIAVRLPPAGLIVDRFTIAQGHPRRSLQNFKSWPAASLSGLSASERTITSAYCIIQTMTLNRSNCGNA